MRLALLKYIRKCFDATLKIFYEDIIITHRFIQLSNCSLFVMSRSCRALIQFSMRRTSHIIIHVSGHSVKSSLYN